MDAFALLTGGAHFDRRRYRKDIDAFNPKAGELNDKCPKMTAGPQGASANAFVPCGLLARTGTKHPASRQDCLHLP